MKRLLFTTSALLLAASARLAACDLCSCAVINPILDPRDGFFLGAAEQFTHFGRVQLDGTRIDNDEDQKLDSSITQAVVGYRFNRTIAVQLNVPFIYRSFRRIEDGEVRSGSVSGLGDISLLAQVTPVTIRRGDFAFQARLIGGLKLPTGDSDRIKEEGAEGHSHGGAEHHHEEEAEPVVHLHEDGSVHVHEAEPEHEEEPHETAESAVHGHDLALGSGSVDVVVGGSIHAEWKRAFFNGEVQYAIRTRGDHSYRYGNDLTWSAGPGVYLVQGDELNFAVSLVCSGEAKSDDKFRGVRADDTAINTVYLGPKFSGSWKDRFAAEVGVDVPVHIWNSATQIVPTYRVRAEVSFSF